MPSPARPRAATRAAGVRSRGAHRRARAQGLHAKEIAAAIAAETGVSRREAYARVIARARPASAERRDPAASRRVAQQREQARFVEHRDAQLAPPSRACCRARRPRPRSRSSSTPSRRHLAARVLDAPLRLVARAARQRAGEHEGLAGERSLAAAPRRAARPRTPSSRRSAISLRLRGSAKKRTTLSAIVGPMPSIASSSSCWRPASARRDRREVAGEQLRDALADVADAERDQEARERGLPGALERRDAGSRRTSRPCARGRRASRRRGGTRRRRA